MTSDTIADILAHAPSVRCFAIASDDLARTNSEHATKHLPRSKRRQGARNEYHRWKQAIDSIIADAKTCPYDTIIERLNLLPLDAVNLIFDPDSADGRTRGRGLRPMARLRTTMGSLVPFCGRHFADSDACIHYNYIPAFPD